MSSPSGRLPPYTVDRAHGQALNDVYRSSNLVSKLEHLFTLSTMGRPAVTHKLEFTMSSSLCWKRFAMVTSDELHDYKSPNGCDRRYVQISMFCADE